MSDPLILVPLVTLAAAILALGLCRLVIMLRVMDAPTEARHVQKTPVPSAGGIGVALAIAAAVVGGSLLAGWPLSDVVIVTGGGAVAALVIGFLDDTLHPPALGKLLLLLSVALAMTALGVRAGDLLVWPGVMLQLPVWLAAAGSILWLIVVINAVNFMDGANGLAMGMAAVAAVGLALVAGMIGAWNIALLAGALAGALCGFLVWNIPGKLFVGDTGTLSVGAVLGGLGLELVRLRPDLVFIPPMLLLPFLSDVLLTLAWRAKHGKKLWVAHRDHVYQIAMKAGLQHWQVALVHAFWGLNAAVFAVMSTVIGGEVPAIAFVLVLLVSTWIHWRIRSSGVKAGLVGADIA